jgi:hypothetical protein
MNATLTKAKMIYDETEQTARDAVDRADTALAMVENLRALVRAIGQDSGATGDRGALIKESEQLLETIRSTELNDTVLTAVISDAQTILGKAAKLKERLNSQLNESKRIAQESLSIATRSQDYRNHLAEVQNQVAKVKSSVKQTTPLIVSALFDGLDGNEMTIRDNLKNAESMLADAQALLVSIAGMNDTLSTQLTAFDSTRNTVQDKLTAYQSDIPQLKEVPLQCDARVGELQHEASRLSGIFGGTRLEAENGVAAAKAYGEIVDTIAAAKDTAVGLADVSLSEVEQSAGESKSANEESFNILRLAADSRGVVVNNLTSTLTNANQAIKGVQDIVVNSKKRVSAMKLVMADLGENGLLSARVEKASGVSAEASEKLDTVQLFVEALILQLDGFANLTNSTVTVAAQRSQDAKGAKTQISQVQSSFCSA